MNVFGFILGAIGPVWWYNLDMGILSPALLEGLGKVASLSAENRATLRPDRHNRSFLSDAASLFDRDPAGQAPSRVANQKGAPVHMQVIDNVLPDKVDEHLFAPPGLN